MDKKISRSDRGKALADSTTMMLWFNIMSDIQNWLLMYNNTFINMDKLDEISTMHYLGLFINQCHQTIPIIQADIVAAHNSPKLMQKISELYVDNHPDNSKRSKHD